MKRQYITPSVFCVKLDPKRTFLADSLKKSEETTGEGGWAREYNTDNTDNTDNTENNRGNIWDNAW